MQDVTLILEAELFFFDFMNLNANNNVSNVTNVNSANNEDKKIESPP